MIIIPTLIFIKELSQTVQRDESGMNRYSALFPTSTVFHLSFEK